MGLYGSMRAAVSGMNAQAARLGTVADNITNSNTTGYKKASTAFSSLIFPTNSSNLNPGGVKTSIQYAISQQGSLSYTSSITDVAIQGAGFFVVTGANGTPSLTRAGSFVHDGNGYLINANGFRLMGYDYSKGTPAPVANGYEGLVPVRLDAGQLGAVPTTNGTIRANLPAGAEEQGVAILNRPPSANSSYSAYSARTSFGHEDLNGGLVGDIYYTKLDDNVWEITVFARLPAQPASFPYPASFPGQTATTTLTFDPVTGAIADGDPILTFNPNGEPMQVDLSALTQTGTPATGPGFRPAMNLPSNYPGIDTGGGDILPAENDPASVFEIRQTLTGYTGLSSPIAVDSYYVKTGPDTWEVSLFNSADATAGSFPYGIAGDPPLATATLTFDPVTGDFISGSPVIVDLGGGDTFEIDYTGMVSVDESHPDWVGTMGTVHISLDLAPAAPIIEPYLLGATPAQNQPKSEFTSKTSLVAYGHLGEKVLLDVYFTKGPEGTWEVTVFDQAGAAPGGGFPYGSMPLATGLVEFDLTTGRLIKGETLPIPIPNGAEMILDLSHLTQLATDFNIQLDVNGSGISPVADYSISNDGIVYIHYENGTKVPTHRLALANVPSPDRLTVLPANMYEPSAESGDVTLGFANEGTMGAIVSGALENSNVDIAEELTNMVESQRNYTANSKVFQTSSDLLDVLVNLKR